MENQLGSVESDALTPSGHALFKILIGEVKDFFRQKRLGKGFNSKDRSKNSLGFHRKLGFRSYNIG
jgi:hypothetical protein